ncbi:hypothetical protein EDB19DRAFT_1828346 [Suillus lakei]|nr:hypothetical protein EDB19DRAFT_1828346 [Suillus lakei]
MHRALTIDYIVHIILKNVTSTTDILNFARTCKSTLGPLVMCLPEDSWEVREHDFIYLCREPLPMEWERVKMNASRIRRLLPNFSHTHSTRSLKPHSSVLHQLFALFPPTSLFPKLCALDSKAVSDLPECRLDFSLLRQFLSPALEELLFEVPSGVPADELEQLVAALPEASGLRSLSISGPSGTPYHLTLPLKDMRKLNSLSMVEIDVYPTMYNIANLQHLRSVQNLELSNLEGVSSTMANSPLGSMPLELSSLKNLLLCGDRIQWCTSFLLRVVTPQLSSIEIKYYDRALLQEVRELMLSIYTSCQVSTSLEDIFVGGLSPWDPDLVCPQLPSYIFRPLLKFRNLANVNFIDIGQFCLDDAFIEDAAVAWPNIQELRFDSEDTDTFTVQVTFTAILSLASRCRSLRTLHLTFDATQFPTIPEAADGSLEVWPTQTALQILHVAHSKLAAGAHLPFFLAVFVVRISSWMGKSGKPSGSGSSHASNDLDILPTALYMGGGSAGGDGEGEGDDDLMSGP